MKAYVIFGYKIIKGKAVIYEEESAKLKIFFENYLKGYGLASAGKIAEIDKWHADLSRMLSNKKYLGDDFYPQIIDEERFEKLQIEKERRIIYYNKNNLKKEKEIFEAKKDFKISKILKNYENHFTQAEYIYGLIK